METKKQLAEHIQSINSQVPDRFKQYEVVKQYASIVDELSNGRVKMFGEEWEPNGNAWYGFDVFLQTTIQFEKVTIRVIGTRNNEDLARSFETAFLNRESMLSITLAYFLRKLEEEQH